MSKYITKCLYSYLIVRPESTLPGVRSRWSRSRSRSSHTSVARASQHEGVSIGGKSNKQLLSRSTIALPVVHSIVLKEWEFKIYRLTLANLDLAKKQSMLFYGSGIEQHLPY